MQTEGEMDGMTCEKCGRSFQTQKELDDHMMAEHGGEGDMASSSKGDGDMP